MINSVDSVSIDLRVLDPKLAKEGEGEHRSRSASVGQKLNARRHKAYHWWNTLFLISCAFAVFNDPIFCYMNTIDDTRKCMISNRKLARNYIISRTVTDVFYLIDFLISTCRCCCLCCCGCCCRSRIRRRSISCLSFFRNLFFILCRLFVCLPIAQILVSVMQDNSQSYRGYVITAFQYTLRIYFIYGSLEQRPIIVITRFERWLKPILGFVPFFLASHLFGAFWYLLATQKQIDCWSSTRHQLDYNFPPDRPESMGKPSTSGYATCGDINLIDIGFNVSQWDELCPVKDADPKTYDFGIYFYALQSNVAGSSKPLLQRVFQSFWWALRNLSSFGSNLNSSMDTREIFFSVLISVSGMALFLVYLNARVQEAQERSNKLLLKEKKLLMKPDVDLWLSKIYPKDMEMDVASRKKKKNLQTLIMEHIHKLEENSDFGMQNILSVLPTKDKQSIMCVLFLASLKKIPMFQTMDERVLKAICQHLVPVTYTEDNYIVQEGKPLGKMLLLTQGSAITYSHGGSSTGFPSNKWLKKGDFYGDELLNWAFKSPSYRDLPISTRNVIAQEKVEAFAVRASDLKSIFVKFWWYFSRDVNTAQLKQWEHLAASSIQASWRNRQERIRIAAAYTIPTSRLRRRAKVASGTSPTHWNRFVVN